MLDTFGAKDGRASSRAVHTKTEFDEAFELPDYQNPSCIQVSSNAFFQKSAVAVERIVLTRLSQVLEVFMERLDMPWRLSRQIEIINERNTQHKK